MFRSYDVADVARAEVGKGPYWPERPSYDLEVHSDDRFEIFFIESLEAVSFMREVAEVFQRVGIQVVDRHDIFWAGGSDPYYRPPA